MHVAGRALDGRSWNSQGLSTAYDHILSIVSNNEEPFSEILRFPTPILNLPQSLYPSSKPPSLLLDTKYLIRKKPCPTTVCNALPTMSCRLARPGYTWLQNLGFYAMKNDWERTVHVKDQESTARRRPPCCKLKATNARNNKTARRVMVFSWASPRTGRPCGDCNICRKFAGKQGVLI